MGQQNTPKDNNPQTGQNQQAPGQNQGQSQSPGQGQHHRDKDRQLGNNPSDKTKDSWRPGEADPNKPGKGQGQPGGSRAQF